MNARAMGRRAVKPLAIAFGLTALVVATPVLGVVGAAAWQQYDPGSLRTVVHRLSAMTHTDTPSGMMDNVIATIDPLNGRPG